jgi:3-methyladenine DNA glycosylase AlkD
VLAVLDDLFAGTVHEEKTLAALILGTSAAARSAVALERVDGWLDGLVGWAQVDSLCSNVFQAGELLDDWPAWQPWLRRLTAHSNINKRRASLVLLTGPVRRSADTRLLEASIDALNGLQSERDKLITKAASWLLRSLVIRHRDAVLSYVAEHRENLPAIAVREVSAKLETAPASQ